MSADTEQSQKEDRIIRGFYAVATIATLLAIGWFVFGNATIENATRPFKLGLDLAGGSHLVYEADTSEIAPEEVPELMGVLRSVIERRVNVFGVSEPVVQVERSSFAAEEQQDRLVVELPGVTDVSQAVAEIGRTPLLEFKLINREMLAAQRKLDDLETSLNEANTATGSVNISNATSDGESVADQDPYVDTGLTGRYLQSAALEFAGGQGGQLSNEPIVSIVFNDEGGDLFERITSENVGEQLAIFLDGEMISAPTINQSISGGRAVISGGFTPDEARGLAQNLNFGALPVPIELVSTQTIGASLGAELLERGMVAGVVGITLVMAFMIFWYRALGVVAVVSLSGYVVIMLALFQLIPVTLTAAGLAAFVLSLGMAVDANVLVFERIKEEWRSGKNWREATSDGFTRAWSAIRDGNITSILSAIILFWFGTSIVKGFALVFGLGVIISMLSAVIVTRTLALTLPDMAADSKGKWRWLYGSGIKK